MKQSRNHTSHNKFRSISLKDDRVLKSMTETGSFPYTLMTLSVKNNDLILQELQHLYSLKGCPCRS